MKRSASGDDNATTLGHDRGQGRVNNDQTKRRRYSNSTPEKQQRDGTDHGSLPPATAEVAGSQSQMMQKETDQRKLAQRQKQIDFGKNTIGYDRYLQAVPKGRRQFGKHPSTPDKYAVASKRAWDGRIQVWRRHLHIYDPESTTQATALPLKASVPSLCTPMSTPTRSLSDQAPRQPSEVGPGPPRASQTSLFDDFDDENKVDKAVGDHDDEDDLL
ncbi:hypothetical protein AaE_013857 [Aphanomyces astaci]|uniref:Histone RNA hairpin-binding protein RNA-binding domain-containing protein n=1 Tax=Aphanomyces astaci TaxID=112090 RepID=A0A6A4ZHF0_APHAT|nr:hypothetical protein AaE_013857 [Aphanomyces astaci]